MGLINGEVLAVLLKDLHRALLKHALQDLLDIASFTDEDSELSGLGQEVEFSQLLHEAFEKSSSLLDEIIILVSHELLLRNGGDVNSRPPRRESFLESEEFREATSLLERTIGINTRNGVFDVAADLDGVEDTELSRTRVFLFENIIQA